MLYFHIITLLLIILTCLIGFNDVKMMKQNLKQHFYRFYEYLIRSEEHVAATYSIS